jgi:hypothetical protein
MKTTETHSPTPSPPDHLATLWTLDPSIEAARRKEYLQWLKLLQFNQNVLCYGIGSKYHILHTFATTLLQDEDVIELSSDSLSRSAEEESAVPALAAASPSFTTLASSTTGSQRKKSAEDTLWGLFQLIRREILVGSRIPSPALWARRSDGSTYPLEHEARLISDYLCRHYHWQRSGMGRRVSNRREVLWETIVQRQSNSSALSLLRAPSQSTELGSNFDEAEDSDGSASLSQSLADEPQPPSLLSASSRALSSRETATLLASKPQTGSVNWDYANSVSRLYLIFHNLEDVLHTTALNAALIHRVLSILADCPVISIVASLASLNTPLYAGWSSAHLSAFQWVYQHTPSPVPHEPLPEVVTAFSNESRKTHTDRADTLKYVLKSLTKKHHEIIKYLLAAASAASQTAIDTPTDSCPPLSSTTATVAGGSGGGGVGWFTLLSHAMTHFISKGDSDLRQLVSELKDQRIVRTHSDRDSKVYVALMLSSVERASALEYYTTTDRRTKK